MKSTRDHGFTGWQQDEYDSLRWWGRDAYDEARWSGATHDEALEIGQKAVRA